MISNRQIKIIFNVILLVEFVFATPYSWGSQHRNYDPSLDPIVWSRSFVQDAIRKPRQYETNALKYNSLDGGEDDFLLQGYDGFGKQRLSRGKLGTEYGNNWYTNPTGFIHHGNYNNNMQKKLYRRRQKLNSRHRYKLQ